MILAGGPLNSNGRNRHLEKVRPRLFQRPKILIDHILDCCIHSGLKTRVLVNSNNSSLMDHLANQYESSIVISVKGPKVSDTFSAAYRAATSDVIFVSGDLIGLRPDNIRQFRDTKFFSAISHYMKPWGRDLVATNGAIKRGDMGESIWMLRFEDLHLLESAKFFAEAKGYFDLFYPNETFNYDIANHYITWFAYAYFHSLMADRKAECSTEKGYITALNKVYRDND